MKLTDFALKEIAKFILGDDGNGINRSGTKLVDLFNKYGCRDIYDFKNGGLPKLDKTSNMNTTRKNYTFDRLRTINDSENLKKLIEEVSDIPSEKWQKINLSIPKRKYNIVSVYENKVKFHGCKNSFRQIIVKDNGRKKPTFIITNNNKLSIKKILEVYARRWRIENKFSELVSFFNLNALSSPLMIRVHFDILWTFIADTFYHILAKDLRRFENHDSKTIFRKFINIPGKVVYDGTKIQIKMRKRAYTPILKSIEKLNKPIKVPWLNNLEMENIWTA